MLLLPLMLLKDDCSVLDFCISAGHLTGTAQDQQARDAFDPPVSPGSSFLDSLR